MNPLLLTDSYKVTHWPQYPQGTSEVYSYFESRGGQFPETVFAGLQYQLARYLQSFPTITKNTLANANNLFLSHFGAPLFNQEGWEHIRVVHNGQLPISIKAVPEGSVVPVSNVLMTVENTCPHCYWLTNYLETLLVQCWYPTTVATISRAAKKLILKYLDRTGDPSLIDFKLHDFGYRGVSSVESAAIGGFAHLINFKGTDTLAALDLCAKYYGEPCAGFSIPASEHSTITSWGADHEEGAFRNMLVQYPKGLVACVSDSFDIFRACSEYWGSKLREDVLQRDGTLVVRPDSGYPPKVVLEVVQRLDKAFGSKINQKGYKVLDPHIRVIQGDGVNLDSIDEILHQLQYHQYSVDNVAFGMGGALLQQCNRDTQKFAFKCSSVTVNGEQRNVFKAPATDPGKNSKAGKLALIHEEGKFATIPASELGHRDNRLREVFRDGKLLVQDTLGSIRDRAKVNL